MTEPRDPFTNKDGIAGFVLPYESVPDDINPGALASVESAVVVGSCTFSTAVMKAGPFGYLPIVFFNFTDGRNRPLLPIGLLLDEDHLTSFKVEMNKAINDAIDKTKKRKKNG